VRASGKDYRDWLGPRWRPEYANITNDNEIVLMVRQGPAQPAMVDAESALIPGQVLQSGTLLARAALEGACMA
jgi:hypothetical protein